LLFWKNRHVAGSSRRLENQLTDLSFLGRLKTSFAASVGDIVFGMEDGTVSIFGLVLGVAATTNDNKTVLIAGASGACAAAVSMMAGTFLEIETNLDQARSFGARLDAELKNNPGAVIAHISQRLQNVGLSDADCSQLTEFVESKPSLLRGVAAAITSSAADDPAQSPLAHALWMLAADFVSAAIPILPFAFAPVATARWQSTAITMLLLVALGIGRGKVGNKALGRTVLETVTIGVAAALAGIGIGLVIAHVI
jgi:VIT1/CCC1 family predicted Fe2+/Mn2+ transporter